MNTTLNNTIRLSHYIYNGKDEEDTRKAFEAVRILSENGMHGIELNDHFKANKDKWEKEQDKKLKKVLKIEEKELVKPKNDNLL